MHTCTHGITMHVRMIWIVACMWHLAANCIKGPGGSGEEGVSFYCTIHIFQNNEEIKMECNT